MVFARFQLMALVYAYVMPLLSRPDEVAELLERRTCVVPAGAELVTRTVEDFEYVSPPLMVIVDAAEEITRLS